MFSDLFHFWFLSILGKSGVWIRATVLDYFRFGNTESNAPLDGQQWYKTTGGQSGLVSNVTIVAGQSASANITATSGTVQLTGVTAGNRLIIYFGARTPSGSSAHFPTVSDSQSQTISTIQSVFVIGNAGAYAYIGQIANALSGTHTITLQTTDAALTSEITITEIHGAVQITSAQASNATGNNNSGHIALSPALVQAPKQVCFGAAGHEVSGGVSAAFTWSGAVQSLTADGTDANFAGITGHFSGAISSNDFGVTRGGTLSGHFGETLVGAIFQ